MRAAPACQVTLQRFGAWRVGVVALTLAGAATLVAWLLVRSVLPPAPALVGAVGLTLLAVAVLAVSLCRLPVQPLRWDGLGWTLGAQPGELHPAIDLGPWMLLRFTPAGQNRAHWLPLQRRGLEGQWHALRCAIYSPVAPERVDAP